MRNLHEIVKFGGKMDTLYNANYFIMVAEDMGFVIDHMGSTRIVGYYGELETALTAVKENRCDIYENTYKYAIVEEVFPGLYPFAPNRWVFEYNRRTGEYNLIDEPPVYLNYANLTIG